MIKTEIFTYTAGTFLAANLRAHQKLEEWLYRNVYIEKVISHTISQYESPTDYTVSISVIYESK